VANRFGYAGYAWDDHLGLYHVRHRAYDPYHGRWLQPDPIGIAGGMNLYQYCDGDPLVCVDPMGLYDISVFEDLIGALSSVWERMMGDPPGDSEGEATPPVAEGIRKIDHAMRIAEPATREALEGGLILGAGVGASIAMTGVSMVPGVGEVMDAWTLLNPAEPPWAKAASGISLAANVGTGGLAPNFGMYYRAAKAADGAGDFVRLVTRGVDEACETGAKVAKLKESPTKAITTFYPPNGGFTGPTQPILLRPGDIIDRYGGSSASRYFSPQGTPLWARSLPPGVESQGVRTFEVLKPFEANSGSVAPWFSQFGGGIQYVTPVPLEVLLRRGILRELPLP
jgi:RHS repeat-associated protein